MDNKIQEGGELPAMDAVDWRTQFNPDSRKQFVNTFVDEIKKHMVSYDPEEDLFFACLKRVSESLEESIYNEATNESSYLRTISLFVSEFKEDHQSPDQESPKMVNVRGLVEDLKKEFVNLLERCREIREDVAARQWMVLELAAAFRRLEELKQDCLEFVLLKAKWDKVRQCVEIQNEQLELVLLRAYWDKVRHCCDMAVAENPGVPNEFDIIFPGLDDDDEGDL